MENDNHMIADALDLMVYAHEDQNDKQGVPYMMHPIRIAAKFRDADAIVVALLHDTVEDSEFVSLGMVWDQFPAHIAVAVDALTKRDGEPYEAYIGRVKRNDLATRVKREDIWDNLDPSRAIMTDEKRRQYFWALRQLGFPDA